MKDLAKFTRLAGGTAGIQSHMFGLSSERSSCHFHILLPHIEIKPKSWNPFLSAPGSPILPGSTCRGCQQRMQESELDELLPPEVGQALDHDAMPEGWRRATG